MKFEALLVVMQMQPLDALWGTKFYTDHSHWPLLIVRLSSLLIRSSVFSKLLKTAKNKTYVIPLPSLDPQPMLMNLQDFLFYVVQPCILISPRIVSPQAVVINYQNITKGPRRFTPCLLLHLLLLLLSGRSLRANCGCETLLFSSTSGVIFCWHYTKNIHFLRVLTSYSFYNKP
jgi:hypothetical protein